MRSGQNKSEAKAFSRKTALLKEFSYLRVFVTSEGKMVDWHAVWCDVSSNAGVPHCYDEAGPALESKVFDLPVHLCSKMTSPTSINYGY